MDTIMDKLMDNLKSFIPAWLAPAATYLYLLSMLLIFPLFNTDKMFHLYLDKRNFFLVSSIVYLCVMLPQILIALYDWGNDMTMPKKPDIIFTLALLAALAISTFLSRNITSTFFEMSSRTISGLCFLVILAIYFAIRQYGRLDNPLLWVWIAGSSAIYICGIFCACGINFFNIQDGLNAAQILIYLTPMSNINYTACYVCLMLPPVMVIYMLCKEAFSQKICAVNLYLGFLFTLFIKTDSSIIAMILGILLLGYFALESEPWADRYTQITGIYLGAKLTICILRLLFRDKLHPFHGTGAIVLDYRILICEILCYLVFLFMWRRNRKIVREKLAAARKILVIIVLAAVGVGVICILFGNINAARLSKESFWQNLVLTDATFNERGFVWRRTASAIKEEPLIRKMFGNGMNSYETLMQIMRKLPADSGYADPHNEILQITTDMGLLGLISYFGLLLSTLVRGFRNWKSNSFYIMGAVTLIIYLIQALMNEYSIYTLPFLFIFLALMNGKSIDTLK